MLLFNKSKDLSHKHHQKVKIMWKEPNRLGNNPTFYFCTTRLKTLKITFSNLFLIFQKTKCQASPSV